MSNSDEDLSLRELWEILWRGKWVIIATTVVFAIGSVAYALLAREWYRAEVLLAPVEQTTMPSIVGQLGGLASLAGVTVGDGDTAEAVATLQSRELARSFIEDFDLTETFFADDWDPEKERWTQGDPADWPDIRDAVRFFLEDVIDVREDRRTQLVTLTVDWTDPILAAKWANELVRRVNAKLREDALRDSETNVAYLQSELAKTSVVALQQSIGRLLESELQRLMLARGDEEFAFRVVDRAEPPDEPIRPQRLLVVILGTILGGMLGVIWIFFAYALRPHSKAAC